MGLFDRTFRRRSSEAEEEQSLPAAPAPVRVAPQRGGPVHAAESLPRFSAPAADQLFRSQATPLARARMRLRDAFTPSQPVTDPAMFAGRGPLLAGLIRAVEDQRLHVVLFGDRGIGKTSLLHVLARQAEEARYLVHYSSCGEESDFDEIFRAALLDVPLLYHEAHGPGSGETASRGSFAELLPAGPLTPRQVSDLLARLSGTRLLVILDEFDRSPAGPFRRQIAELIKNLSDRSIRAQLVIAGVAQDLTRLIEHIPSIRRNILGIAVPNMAPDEIGALIRNGERASGLTFDEATVELVTYLASGSPYVAGLLAQGAGLVAADRQSLDVAPADVVAAIGRSCDEIGQRISEPSRFAVDRADAEGLLDPLGLLAHAAIRDGGRFGEEALADLSGDRAERQALLVRLQRHGLIRLVEHDPAGRCRFDEEGVAIYLWMRVARDRFGRV